MWSLIPPIHPWSGKARRWSHCFDMWILYPEAATIVDGSLRIAVNSVIGPRIFDSRKYQLEFFYEVRSAEPKASSENCLNFFKETL